MLLLLLHVVGESGFSAKSLAIEKHNNNNLADTPCEPGR